MVRVRGSKAGRAAGDQQVIVDDVERKTAVYRQGRAFVFVESEHRRQMRHHAPKIDDAIADIDAGRRNRGGRREARPRALTVSLSRIN
jgi:ribosomal protein L14E/L6E/L27E